MRCTREDEDIDEARYMCFRNAVHGRPVCALAGSGEQGVCASGCAAAPGSF